MGSGRLNGQVGGKLGIGKTALQADRQRMMRKMKVRSHAGSVKVAASIGLGEPAAKAERNQI
jgi:FixJ family two-component response regulator